LYYIWFQKIKQAIRQRSANKHITNKHAATLARVDIHRQDDGDGYVEAWDQHHDIVGMEELSHDIYEEVQTEQID
jgi:5,10-methylene-tetrahydrofolate dehydrogenase/methenyl tetrahydrofolate cyclohydrolase